MMPDHLPKPDVDVDADDADAELQGERDWLRSNITAFVEPGSSDPLPKREGQPRHRPHWC